MSISTLKFYQLSWLSKPACDRAVYRSIKNFKVRSVLEIGMATGQRAENMVRLCQKYGSGNSVRYTGIDLFEERAADQPPMQLISVHKRLSSLGAKAQLVPGTLGSSIARIANAHVRTDLIVISAGYEQVELESNWGFFPRMLHAESLVFLQPQGDNESKFQILNRLQVERLAKQFTPKPLKSHKAA